MPEPALVIVAQSGRALAQAAASAGRAVHVIDLYADQDTLRWARSVVRIAGGEEGLDASGVMGALEVVSRRDRIAGAVAGSGFEGQPELLAAVGERQRIIGNPPEVVQAVKDPSTFFGPLSRLGIPHPEVRLRDTGATGRWLLKRIGAAGGAHVRPVKAGCVCGPGYYLQRQVAGRACSAVFVADGRAVKVVGYCETWGAHEDPSCPYRYAGAMSVSAPRGRLARELGEALRELVAAFDLRGLCGVDFVLDEAGGWQLLELNPRPTATFELHGPAGPLWEYHLRASAGCLGRLAAEPPGGQTAAQRVLYAMHPIRVSEGLSWPRWSRDRPRAGTVVEAGQPVCTVTAVGRGPDEVLRRLGVRSAALGRLLGLSVAETVWPCDSRPLSGLRVSIQEGSAQNG